jgi:hypothetical protein
MIKRMIVGVAILFGMLLLLLPRTDESSKTKIASASMLLCSRDFRVAIAEQIARHEPVDLVFENKCPALISGVEVGEEGALTLHNTTYGLVIVLTPMTEKGQVRWSCRGEPASLITSLCKD